MAELHDLTALQQGAAIARGETSSAELVLHYLDRIGRLNDELGAFVHVVADPAPSVVAHGPLAGVPTAIKDLNNTAGVPTEYGAEALAGYVPDFSDEMVQRVERAGMVSLGKTATPEFGSPCYTEPFGHPAAVTPWDTTRMAGGSSGGAAAAVSGGLVPIAQGSDGGGSIRIPASCCGLVGLKPSRNRISAAPMYGEITGLATNGVLARTVRDAAAMLDVMAGRAVGDPAWQADPTMTFLSACERPKWRMRVARFIDPVIADAAVDPEVRTAYENASSLLYALGHEVIDIEMPLPREAVAVFETCWAVLTAMSTTLLPAGAPMRPLSRWLGERGKAVSGPEFGLALGELRRVAAGVLTALAPYDVVLTPTLAVPPLPVGAIRNDDDPAADFEAQKRFTPYTSLWNVTGSPAISLPLAMSSAGLPIGMMLACPPGNEAELLALAAQIESAEPWLELTPPCW